MGRDLNVLDFSIIQNCGDFQMAHRELWRRAGFKKHMLYRNVVDSLLQASWMNQDAVLQVFDTTVLHMEHSKHETIVNNELPSITTQKINGTARIVDHQGAVI